MSRKRQGRPVSGWIALDKPAGIGSTQAVGRIKRLYEAAKAGHAGTLDPLASGLLPVALGEATKTVPFAMDGDKTYVFTLAFGAETDTGDREGRIVARSAARPGREALLAALPAFLGEIEQVPPAFSAIRIGGERAYDLARAGNPVEPPPRRVVIKRLELDRFDGDLAELSCDCSKGAYVRSLARDLARALGCLGHVSALRRTRVGPFGAADMVALGDLEALAGDLAALDAFLRPPVAVIGELPRIAVTAEQAVKLRLGNAILLRGRDAIASASEAGAVFNGDLVAIGAVDQGMFYPRRVFVAPS
jgi:tRNA pseudouridine55 synthase